MEIIGDSIDEVWTAAATALLRRGRVTSPHGVKTREILGTQLILTNPRRRIPLLSVRKFSLSYAMGELAWYLSGDDSVKFMERYAPSYGKYSDDGKRLHGAYGPRIFNTCCGTCGTPDNHSSFIDQSACRCDQSEHVVADPDRSSQWDTCKALLQKDPDSRQAVISIYRPGDCGYATKDMPCTLSLQFLIRDKMLHLVVNMRSNDLWLGGLYDPFCFTALQEIMALELQLNLGVYYHHVGSFHVYEKNVPDLERCLESYRMQPVIPVVAPVIPAFANLAGQGGAAIKGLLECEARIWTEDPLESMDTLNATMPILDAAATPNLWALAYAAWRWKIVSSGAAIKETQRRVMAELMRQAMGPIFERCFH